MPDMNWKPFTIDELQKLLVGFDRWFLDGGVALDHFLGRSTRAHGDLDIGIFSEDADALLTFLINGGLEVYDASSGLERVTSPSYREQSYNYWVSDRKHYKVQVLVYNAEGRHVVFRRNPEVKWPRQAFILMKGQLHLVNPLVIYAFKVTTKSIEQKDLTDIASLFKLVGSNDA